MMTDDLSSYNSNDEERTTTKIYRSATIISSRKNYNADMLVVLMAVALPWSTTIFSILTAFWLLALASASNLYQLWNTFKKPQCFLPVALFGLAIIGMLWSGAPWLDRIHAASTFVKLLAIPLLVYQFEKSHNGMKVLLAFLFSCTLLLLLSWLNWFDHRTILFSTRVVGVPVKNWITQGVEFVLCIFGAGALSIAMWRARRYYISFGCAFLSLLFLFNIVFVVSSRTALVTLPLIFLCVTFTPINQRHRFMIYGAIAFAGMIAWFASSNLQMRLESLQQQFDQYEAGTGLASVGLRLEYWTKSLKFVEEAPLIGHGTGAIRLLFERDSSGKTVISDEIVANPHNQTLYCAIQWGIIGVFLLWAMWISHLASFLADGLPSWLGILIVVQSIFSSLFNSHITDFVEGWIYVLGVGIALGIALKSRTHVED